MKQIKFKKEFEDKLNELGIKERFLELFIISCKEIKGTEKESIAYLNAQINWELFICSAFLFPEEEKEFWIEISKK